MNIRIIKNGYVKGNRYGNHIIEKEFSDSKYEGIRTVRYYEYNPEKNVKIELLPKKTKYDIFITKCLDKTNQLLYYATISDALPEKQKINLCTYNMDTGESKVIYSYQEDISQYVDYKRIRLFVLNEFYLLFQNEYIRYNLTETIKGYFEFEQFLYQVETGKMIQIMDENLHSNGIENIKVMENNICVLKTGFNLIKDERYKHLSKEEVSFEKISFVNLGQLVSDILLMKKDIVIDTVDQAYYNETFPYTAVKGDYVVYSKVDMNKEEEQVVFYNTRTKESTICINKNVTKEDDLAWSYLLEETPYIRLKAKNGTQFYNLLKNKVDISFNEDSRVETAVNDVFIVTEERKKLFGKKNKSVAVYKYPDKELLHREKGEYLGYIAKGKDNIYIFMS